MFVDWPTEKRLIGDAMNRVLRAQTRAQAPIAFLFPRFVFEEGDEVVFVGPEGQSSSMGLRELEVSATTDNQAFLKQGAVVLEEVIDQLARSAAESMETDLFAKLREASESAGGVFDASDPDSIVDGFLQLVEKMDVGFDESGAPTIFVAMHPGVWEKVRPVIEAANESAELQGRYDAIIDRKRHEWLRRENHRRLVD